MFWFENYHKICLPFSYNIKKVTAKIELLQKNFQSRQEIYQEILSICNFTQFVASWALQLFYKQPNIWKEETEKPNMVTRLAYHQCLAPLTVEVLRTLLRHQMIMSFQRPTTVEDWQDQPLWWFRLTTKALEEARMRWPLTANSIRLIRRTIPIAFLRRLKTRVAIVTWFIMFYPLHPRMGVRVELDFRCILDPSQDPYLLDLDHPHPPQVLSHLLHLPSQSSKQEQQIIRQQHLGT